MVKLSNWMAMKWLPRDMMAEKYIVGQDLNREQAAEIIRIIARSVDLDLNKTYARKDAFQIGTPYRDFVVCILLLMQAGEHNQKWRGMIWDALSPRVRGLCYEIIDPNTRKH